MLVEKLMDLIYKVLDLAFTPINIPGLPDGMSDQVASLIGDLLNYASSMITLFIPWNQVKVFFPILIAILGAEEIYKLVMWVLRKIPMLGIS